MGRQRERRTERDDVLSHYWWLAIGYPRGFEVAMGVKPRGGRWAVL